MLIFVILYIEVIRKELTMKSFDRQSVHDLLKSSSWKEEGLNFECPQNENMIAYTIPKRLVIEIGDCAMSFPFDEIFSLRFSDFGLRINGGVIGVIDN